MNFDEQERIVAALPWYSLGIILIGLALIIYTWCTISSYTGLIQSSTGMLVGSFISFIVGISKLFPPIKDKILIE